MAQLQEIRFIRRAKKGLCPSTRIKRIAQLPPCGPPNTLAIALDPDFRAARERGLEGETAMSNKQPSHPALMHFRTAVDETYGGRVERVMLFGSRARGDAASDSDYDVAV